MSEPLHSVGLLDDELVLLDGRCSEKVQAAVDGAKRRVAARAEYPLSAALAGLIADVVSEATANGEVIYRRTHLRWCHVCGKAAGYAKYKSGMRRGQSKLDKPLTLDGIEFARRFITVQGSVAVGACADCVAEVMPYLPRALSAVQAALPEPLRLPDAPAYKRYDRRRCPECKWEGHEGEMGRLPTVMFDGTYPGKCPSCGFKSLPFGKLFETVDGFAIVTEPVEAERGRGPTA